MPAFKFKVNRTLRLILPPLLGCALTTLTVAGCAKQAAKLSVTQSTAFDGAAPDIKKTWDQALAADQSSNYVDALKLLNSVKQMQLTDEQRDTLNVEFNSFDQRLWSAAAKNDPSAVQAVQIMRTR